MGEEVVTTIIQCPQCGSRYRVKIPIVVGQLLRCKDCQSVWRHGEEAPDTRKQSGADEDGMHGALMRPQDETADSGGLSGGGGQSVAQADAPRTPWDDRGADKDDAGGEYDEPAASESQGEDGSFYAGQPADEGSQGEDVRNGYSRYDMERERTFGDGFYSAFDEARQASSAMDEDDLEQRERELRASGGYHRAPRGQHDFVREMADALGRPTQREEGEAAEEAAADDRLTERTWDYEQEGARYRSDESAEDFDQNYPYGANEGEQPFEDLSAPQLEPLWRDGDATEEADRETLSNFAPRPPLDGSGLAGVEREARKGFGGLAVASAWATYLIVMGGLAAAALSFKDSIVEAMPGAGRYYAMLGFEQKRKVLSFENVTYEIATRNDQTVLEVRGLVVNATDRSVDVPTLYITVRDDRNAVIATTKAIVAREPLAANAKAPFTLEFLSPPPNLSAIELRFTGTS